MGAAGFAALPGDSQAGGKKSSTSDDAASFKSKHSRLPVVFLPHGGGPWPFVELGFPKAELQPLAEYLKSVAALPKTPPRAILIISAHWEESVPTVMTGAHPPMLYDYYGFPPESYQITWPAPGHPQIAEHVRTLLGAAGFATAADHKRGFDHGTFVPLKLMYPEAAVPTVQLSLKTGLDPQTHIAMGRALAPLRDEGVFIVGSGMSYHNLRGLGDPRAIPGGKAFDAWLQATATLDSAARDKGLAAWERAPSARQAHPREEHLIPLMVVAGAAGTDRATVAFNGQMMGVPISAYHFG